MSTQHAERLKWSGNIRAQQECDDAYLKLQPKKKPPKPKKIKTRNRKKGERRIETWVTYADYLRTRWWMKRRRRAIGMARHKCNRCNSRDRLQVHHKHYDSLGKEKDADLEVLCRQCHEREHAAVIAQNAHLDAIAGRA